MLIKLRIIVMDNELIKAASKGDAESVQRLLSTKEIDINATNTAGYTALMMALLRGHDNVAEILINAGADVNISNFISISFGATALGIAINNGRSKEIIQLLLTKSTNDLSSTLRAASLRNDEDIVKMLLDAGANVKSYGYIALEIATRNSNKSIIRMLLDAGVILNERYPYGDGILFPAVEKNNKDIIKLLIDAGANVDAKDIYNIPLLVYAIKNGNKEVAELLIKAGAEINVYFYNGYRKSILIYAVEKGNRDIVQLLLDAGADINAVDEIGDDAFTYAANHGHYEVVKLLLENGVKADAADHHGWTRLITAAKNGHYEVVKLLLENGAKIDAADRKGYTALTMAAMNGHDKVVQLLIENGAKIDALNACGETALITAAMNGHNKIVKLLLENGAQTDATNRDGWTLTSAVMYGLEKVRGLLFANMAKITAASDWTALMMAANYGHYEVVKLLLENGANIHAQNQDGKTASDLAKTEEIKEMLKKAAVLEWIEFKVFGGEFRSIDNALIEKYEDFIREEVTCFSQFNTQLFLHVLEHTPGLGEALQEEKHTIYMLVRDNFSDMGQICALKAQKFERKFRYKKPNIDDLPDSATFLENSPEDIFQRVNKIFDPEKISLEDALFAMHFISYNYIDTIKLAYSVSKTEDCMPEAVKETESREKDKKSDILDRLGLDDDTPKTPVTKDSPDGKKWAATLTKKGYRIGL